MLTEPTPEEQDCLDLLARYNGVEEKEQAHALTEARFQDDLELALALSRASLEEDDVSTVTQSLLQVEVSLQERDGQSNLTDLVVDADDVAMDSRGDHSTSRTFQAIRSLSERGDNSGSLVNEASGVGAQSGDNAQTNSSHGLDTRSYHPSGRRRSIELAQQQLQEALQARNGFATQQTHSGNMEMDTPSYHPSGRRRSIELAEEQLQQALQARNGNSGQDGVQNEVNDASGDRTANQGLMDVQAQGLDNLEDLSDELKHLIRTGVVKPFSVTSPQVNVDDNELFGHGNRATRLGQSSNHRLDFKHPFPFDSDGVPVNWDKLQVPSLSSSEYNVLVELFPGSDEYDTIARDFDLADLDVLKIERLQNVHLLDKYKGELEHVLKRRPSDFDPCPRYLYHGSAANKLTLCEEGLDARLGMSGCFGKGIYFSDNPRKCIQYVSSSGVPFILMCRVLLGDTKVYPKGQMDRSLKREPEKPNPKGTWKFYDSVKGQPIDYNEFVIYENRRAMIEYIITFERRGGSDNYAWGTSNTGAAYGVVSGATASPAPSLPSISLSGNRPLRTDFTGVTIGGDTLEDYVLAFQRTRENVRQSRAQERGEVYTPPGYAEKKRDLLHWKRLMISNCSPGYPGHENLQDILDFIDKMEYDMDEEERQRQLQAQGSSNTGKVTSIGGAASANNPGNTSTAGHNTEDMADDFASGNVTVNEYVYNDREIALVTARSLEEAAQEEVNTVEMVKSSLVADFCEITGVENVDLAKMYVDRSGMNLDAAILLYYEENA